ncbi:group II intron maturase-specific domain-containing protein [Georgenia yuyongxinii]
MKTKIVHCPNGKRAGSFPEEQFTFLGYTFRPRGALSRSGAGFTGFLPAISDQALKGLNARVRSWRLHKRLGWTLADLARWLNPIVRGWMQYYGAFYPSRLHRLLARINAYLIQWLRRKYKRLKPKKRTYQAWRRIIDQYPRLFAHWAWVRGADW